MQVLSFFTNRGLFRCNRGQKIDLSASSENENELSIREEVDKILDKCLTRDTVSGDLTANVDLSILLENAHILTKDGIYEEAYKDRINSYITPKDIEIAEKADDMIRAFINAERKLRARLKLNYILAGATSSRLDEAINTLAESDEIDIPLIVYTEALIDKELIRCGGPTSLSEADRTSVPKTNQITLDILRMIRKRLQAELRLQAEDKNHLRLLAQLTAENNIQIRELLLKQNLIKVEDLDEFNNLLDTAIIHISENDNVEGQAGMLEKLRDIRVSVQRQQTWLRTGLQDEEDQFSTSPEDYLDSI